MNSREILEYSRQLVAAKTEIETAQKAEPDLEDQVKTKFREDTVNRARFVDATLVIGAATKEFRNVFGVDAPHYELSDKCYLAVDRNGDGRYITSFDKNNYPIFDEGDGPIYVEDPMGQEETTRYYLDCWELANAARFDSTLMCSNYFGDNGNELFVNKQKFFVDNKKDSESSAAHNPICPPGYDKWAGNKIYNYICKCFDLDELNLFRLLGNKNIQTIPYTFEIKANGDDKFECNINEDGIITKNIFNYEFVFFIQDVFWGIHKEAVSIIVVIPIGKRYPVNFNSFFCSSKIGGCRSFFQITNAAFNNAGFIVLN